MKSWNEIRKAATAFSKRWKDAYDEKSQAQSFLKEFFAVFGVDAVTVATFEHRVKFAPVPPVATPVSPDSPVPPVIASISAAAQAVLDARAAHPGATLAGLYDPLTMPPDLVKAHAHLDALVDKAYGLRPTATDSERVALLFKLYAEKTISKETAQM